MKALIFMLLMTSSFGLQAKTCKEAKIAIEVELFHLEEQGADIVLNKEFTPLHNNWSSAYPELGKIKINQNKILEVILSYKDKEGKEVHKGSIIISDKGTSTTDLRDFISVATEKAAEGKIIFEIKEGQSVLCQESMDITTVIDQ
jgi:co-chaperonin GroES (HSP10)